MTDAIHPGGLTAAQSLAFFRANNVVGVELKSRHRARILASYRCRCVFLGGAVQDAEMRILATRAEHHLIAQ